MIGVEKVLTAKEERVRSMKEQEIYRLHGWRNLASFLVQHKRQITLTSLTTQKGKAILMRRASHSKRARMNIITPDLAAAFYRAKMSDLNATFVLTATANSLSCNIAHININRSTIRRHRKCCGASFSARIRSDFTADVPLIVHWDGEHLEDLTSKQRGPAANPHLRQWSEQASWSSEGDWRVRGKSSSAVAAILSDWGVAECVKAMYFDRTAANPGHRIGGACSYRADVREGSSSSRLLSSHPGSCLSCCIQGNDEWNF